MTAVRRPRANFLLLIAAAVVLALLPVAVAVWIERDGADGGALDATIAGAPVVPAARFGDAASSAAPAPGRAAESLPVPAPAPAALPEVPDGLGPRVDEAGLFAGVPRSWLAPVVITGRVVDAAGAPLAGASVRFMPDDVTTRVVRQALSAQPGTLPGTLSGAQSDAPPDMQSDAQSDALPGTLADADGRFTLSTWRGLPGAGFLTLDRSSSSPSVVITADGSPSLAVACPSRAGVVDLGTLVLAVGAVLRGRVVDGRGIPLVGVRVNLMPRPEPAPAGWAGNVSMRVPDSTRTDARGAYVFEHLWPGSGRVQLVEPGWRQSQIELPRWDGGASVQAPDLVADVGGTLRGVVLDAQGRPLEGVVVRVLEGYGDMQTAASRRRTFRALEAGWPRLRTVSGADGGFAIAGLDRKPQNILAGGGGYEPVAASDVWPGGRGVMLRMEQSARDPAAPSFQLEIVDATGERLEGAAVLAGEVGRAGTTWDATRVERIGSGRFGIACDDGVELTLLVSAPRHATRHVELSCAGLPDGDVVRIELPAEARVDGVVRDDTGAPVPGAWVRALPFGNSSAGAGIVPVACDAQGRFTLRGLAAGNWPLDVLADNLRPETGSEVHVAEGEHVTGLVVTLQRTGAVAGRVLETSGGSPRLADDEVLDRVELRRVSEGSVMPGPRRATLDRTGRFRIEGLTAGDYEVSSTLAEAAGPVVTVRAGETTEIDIVVPSPPLVRGRVLAGILPVAGALVRYAFVPEAEPASADGIRVIGDFSAGLETTRSAADGSFELHILGAGRITVWAETPTGSSSEPAELVVSMDAEVAIELQLATARIEGDVVDADRGAALPGVEVRLGNSQRPVLTDEQGRFVLEGMEEGGYPVSASAPGYLTLVIEPVLVGRDEVVTGVRFTLQRGARVFVTVLAPDGQPVDVSPDVMAWRADGVPLHALQPALAFKTAAGRAELDVLPAGKYFIGLPGRSLQLKPGYAAEDVSAEIPNRVLVDLAPGDVREVTLHVVESD